MDTKKLTDKQALFVAAKLAGMTNEAAAIHAGYSMGSAKSQATALLKLPKVRAALRKGKRDTGKRENMSAADMIAADLVGNPERRLRDKYDSPLDLFLDVMNNNKFPDGTRIACAKEAMPYCNARVGEKGKKEQKKDAAAEVSRGRYSPKQPPRNVRAH